MASALSVANVMDTEKYSLAGILLGTAIGSATEFVANALVQLVGIEYNPQNPQTMLGELLLRSAVAGVGFLVGGAAYNGIVSNNDPTGAMMFGYGYTVAQGRLYRVTVGLGMYLSDEDNFRELLMGKPGSGPVAKKPCCSGCAKTGGSCHGK